MRKFGYVQQVVEDFFNSEEQMMVVSILPETYANPNSARCAYRCAIKKLGYSIAIRMIHGDMYLIRVQNPNWTAKNRNNCCNTCGHRYPSSACATCKDMSNFEHPMAGD